jgi:DNA mismatch endonuclease (patch repair protein)
MQAVRRSGTGPELRLAELLSQLNVEFEQNVASLPGKPDFWFPRFQLAVFVHGCFWHGHPRCAKGKMTPKTNRDYWQQKIKRNIARDRKNARQLRSLGISVITTWECELRRVQVLPGRLSVRLAQTTTRGVRKKGDTNAG